MTVNREEVAGSVDVAEWSWLRAHLERGGLIVISEKLDLTDVACKIANNDSSAVEGAIASGDVGKPSEAQIKLWNSQPAKLFKITIVSPYVIIQEQT